MDRKRAKASIERYIARNRDALNASIRKSRTEIARDEISKKSIDNIIAEGRDRFSSKFETAVREGLIEAEGGDGIPYVKIRRWLLSWGSDEELRPPE